MSHVSTSNSKEYKVKSDRNIDSQQDQEQEHDRDRDIHNGKYNTHINPLSGENVCLNATMNVKHELPDLNDQVLLKLNLKHDIKS